MQKIRLLYANILFVLGDIVSRSFLCRWSLGANLYHFFMTESVLIQDKYNLSGPWGPPNKEKEEDED